MMTIRLKGPYAQPAFVAAVVLLVAAAAGLNVAVASLKLHFRKLPVPLTRPLADMPSQLGDWTQVSRDEPLNADMEEVLGTDKYIFRDYINIPAHGGHCAALFVQGLHCIDGVKFDVDNDTLNRMEREVVEASPADQLKIVQREMQDKSNNQRRIATLMAQRAYPDAVVNLTLTYYTGLADTVAHIPDRCYVADGFEPDPANDDEPTWKLADGRQLTLRFINFQDAGDRARPDRSVAYFFQVNGAYASNSGAVRIRMQNLFQKYGYYLKVELMTMDQDHERSARTITDFLNVSLSEVEKSYPDWNKYNTTSKSTGK